MTTDFKRVPAIDKCFGILSLLAKVKKPIGISEIAKALGYNKSTVFNMIHTLMDLGILEKATDNKFTIGTKLYILGREAGNGSQLIQTVHPFLEKINKRIKLSAFLGIRSGMRAVILDKVDSAFGIRISSDIGMRLPLLAGAGGKALLSQLSDIQIDEILDAKKLKKFTSRSCVSKKKYKKMVQGVREEGIALDDEEYIEGVYAIAVPIKSPMNHLQTAIWAFCLKKFVNEKVIPEYSNFMKQIANEIESRFFIG